MAKQAGAVEGTATGGRPGRDYGGGVAMSRGPAHRWAMDIFSIKTKSMCGWEMMMHQKFFQGTIAPVGVGGCRP